jgi:hypothetical protein
MRALSRVGRGLGKLQHNSFSAFYNVWSFFIMHLTRRAGSITTAELLTLHFATYQSPRIERVLPRKRIRSSFCKGPLFMRRGLHCLFRHRQTFSGVQRTAA